MKAHKISLAALFVALGMGTGCNIVLDIDNEYVAGDGGGPVNVSSGQGGAGGMTGSGGGGGMVGAGGAGGGTSEACTPSETAVCYSGDPSTEGVGVCTAGTKSCNDNGEWGPCDGEVTPASEICDGIDNDCDGVIDDGNPDGGGLCNTNNPGICNVGTFHCQGGALVCISGVQASSEICDGIDNDCDGSIDNGLGVGTICTVGVGACAKSGALVCDGNGGVKCSATPGLPSTEVCDGIDNDCDGSVDEGFGLGNSCSVGTGACTNAGSLVCDGMGGTKCSATPGLPSPEVCDGIDNDCDGSTDEGNPGGGANCNTGKSGVCSAGTMVCSGGTLVCNQNVQASTEVCDSLDNDCDGLVDDACLVCIPGTQVSCGCGLCTLTAPIPDLNCDRKLQSCNIDSFAGCPSGQCELFKTCNSTGTGWGGCW